MGAPTHVRSPHTRDLAAFRLERNPSGNAAPSRATAVLTAAVPAAPSMSHHSTSDNDGLIGNNFPTWHSFHTKLSASSLTREAESCSTNLAIEMSVPRLIAKSPALVKARIAAVRAAEAGVPPKACAFTLRGTRQTRSQPSNGSRDETSSGERDTTTMVSPTRPSSSFRVVLRTRDGRAEGHSPRLRMMRRERDDAGGGSCPADLSTTSGVLVESSTAGRSQYPLEAFAAGDTAVSTSGTLVAAAAASTTCRRRPCPCEEYAITSCELYPGHDDRARFLLDGEEATAMTATSNAFEDGKARSCPAPYGREHAIPTKSQRLCGRLWTGTTKSPKFVNGPNSTTGGKGNDRANARPARTLFLVSGQGQHQPTRRTQQHQRRRDSSDKIVGKNHRNYKSNDNRTNDGRHHAKGVLARASYSSPAYRRRDKKSARYEDSFGASGELSAARGALPRDPGAPTGLANQGHGSSRSTEFGVRQGRNDEDFDGKGPGERGDGIIVVSEAHSGLLSRPLPDDFSYDAVTSETIAGDADDGRGRRVLHVRVPRPPPTSLLIMRSASPSALEAA